MPIGDNGKGVFCLNHASTSMIKEETLNALPNFKKVDENGGDIIPKANVVNIFTCPKCGYVEMYLESFVDKITGYNK